RYLLALSADHGVCPLPEVSRALGRESARVPLQLLDKEAEAFLREKFGKKDDKAHWVESAGEPWVYLNRRLLRERRLDQAAVEAALADWFRQQPGIQACYTRSELLKGPPADDAVEQTVRLSFE